VLFRSLGSILSPFLFAAIIAYICAPAMDWLVRHHMPPTLATLLVMGALLRVVVALMLILVPVIYDQATAMLTRIPDWIELARARLMPWLQQQFGVEWPLDMAHLRASMSELLGPSNGGPRKLLELALSGGSFLLGLLSAVLLMPLALFYILRDWRALLNRGEQLIPRRMHGSVTGILGEIDVVLGQFLRAQLGVMLIMSAYYSLGMWLAGLHYALPIGILAGMLVFVPYVGMLVGLTLATVSAMTQFGSWAGLVPVWIAFAIGQALEGMFLTPWLVGERIGLHPLAVIFALLAFGQLFGFVGVLLALPASAALLVALRHARARYFASALYKS